MKTDNTKPNFDQFLEGVPLHYRASKNGDGATAKCLNNSGLNFHLLRISKGRRLLGLLAVNNHQLCKFYDWATSKPCEVAA